MAFPTPTPASIQASADALRACTGAVRVTVHDSGLTATSTPVAAPRRPLVRIERSRRLFAVRTRFADVLFSRGLHRDWSLQVLVGYRRPPFNKGAGYIGGATAFLTWRCVDKRNMYTPRTPLQLGVTRNANLVPWTRS